MRMAALALVGAAALVLAGCTPAGSPTGSPKPTATPVFASDAAALKAAEAAYEAYLVVSDDVAKGGGADPGQLAKYVTKSRLKVEEQGAALLVKSGVHTAGSTTFSNSKLEQVERTEKNTTVIFYTCWDVSSVRVLDSSGNDVTPSGRPDKSTLEVTMTTARGVLPLLLERDETWSGATVC